jgi:hypothetical protein
MIFRRTPAPPSSGDLERRIAALEEADQRDVALARTRQVEQKLDTFVHRLAEVERKFDVFHERLTALITRENARQDFIKRLLEGTK